MHRPHRRTFRPEMERLDPRWLPAALAPTQVVSAYDLDAITFRSASGASVKGDGTGQTIAIVVAYHDRYLAADLAAFSRKYDLPRANLVQIFQPGTRSDDDWAGEATLDVQYAHAVAPGAKLVVVEAASPNLSDILKAVDTARRYPGVSVVSMSWGTDEPANQRALDRYFTTPSKHRGVTFVAATGDSSAYAGAQWPSTSPNVLAVGGTRLNVDASGNYQSEKGWYSSGGGYSRIESTPVYQRTVQRNGSRSVPDVSAVADPSTGVSVLTTNPSDGDRSWWVVGGTSVATPIWAGIIAIVNQGRALAGLNSLDGRSQTLPAIYALPSSSFHDVRTGSNGYQTRSGYDLVTGRGSPDGDSLVYNLAAWGTGAQAYSATRAKYLLPRYRIRTTGIFARSQNVAAATATASMLVSTDLIATTSDIAPVRLELPAQAPGRASWSFALGGGAAPGGRLDWDFKPTSTSLISALADPWAGRPVTA